MSLKKAVIYTNLLWLAIVTSCASMSIKTWIIGPTGLTENQTQQVLTFLEAQGYRCYSESDDEFWRNELAIAESCCKGSRP